MQEYGIYEAKTKLAELVKKVQQGTKVTITNRGTPVAELIPSAAKNQTRNAIAAIKALRKKEITQAQYTEMRERSRR